MKYPRIVVLLRSSEEDLNGMRTYYHYKKNESERWNVVSGLGAAYINLSMNYIRAVYNGKITREDILPFLLFCSNPLLSLIRRFGFPFLHAACLNINGKHALIAGLSGRGKSTATFSLIKRGHTALTDEATLIKKMDVHYNAYVMMGWIKVEEGAKKRFFTDTNDAPVRCGADHIYKLSDINHNKENEGDAKLDYIFILEQTGLPNTKIKSAGALEVIKELFPVALSNVDKDYAEAAFEIFGDLMESVKLRKIYFGTNMELFVDAVEEEIG